MRLRTPIPWILWNLRVEFTDELLGHQKSRIAKRRFAGASWAILFLTMQAAQLCAQQTAQTASADAPSTVSARSTAEPTKKPGSQINVNWFYGSYVPKDVPLEPLSGDQRLQLYFRQTYTTWGIYIKTMLFTVHDQVHDTNPEWGDGAGGFVKRLGTRQVQFIVQNSVTSLSDGIVGWEPRRHYADRWCEQAPDGKSAEFELSKNVMEKQNWIGGNDNENSKTVPSMCSPNLLCGNRIGAGSGCRCSRED